MTKEKLTRQFHKVQKQYLEAVRVRNDKEVIRLASERDIIQKQIRRFK